MTPQQLVQNTLGSQAFLLVNKALLRYVGSANAAIILSSLISKHSYFQERDMLQDGGFFNTKNMLQDETGLSEKVILAAEKILQSKGLIDCKLKGIPARKFYYLNWVNILKALSNPSISQTDEPVKTLRTEQSSTKGSTSTAQTAELDNTKGLSNNNKEIITNNNNKEISLKEEKLINLDSEFKTKVILSEKVDEVFGKDISETKELTLEEQFNLMFED